MGKRLHQLDSLRGIAALSVMLSHIFLVYPVVWNTNQPAGSPWWLKLAMFSPLRVAWAGHEAVIFFFILSGFVLALIFFGKSEAPPYRLYLLKRILRIYPPYLAAALSAIALRELVFAGPVPSVSDWFNQSWQNPASARAVIDHTLMIGSFNNCDFNPVLWSLVHEMRISIFFPLIAWGLVRAEKLCLLLAVVFTFIYWLTINLKFKGVISFDHDYFATLHYTGFFIVGAYLAKHRGWILNAAQQMPKTAKWLLLGAALLAYSNAFWLPYYGTSHVRLLAIVVGKTYVQDWITASGVVVFIILALSTNAISGLLAIRPLVFLGSISYSLYLFHALVLKIIVTLLVQVIPLPAALGIAVACALIVSTASWRFIECPCIELGKILTKKWHMRRTSHAQSSSN
jgi:peptidoglycan/LPS O-acetylase OafA/YrhL